MIHLRWVFAATVLGLGASGVFVSVLHFPRDLFVGLYAATVTVFFGLLLRTERIDPRLQIRRRWIGGLIGGVVAGAVLARTVILQPASPAPSGARLVWNLLWDGGVYGFADGLLLSVLPVLVIYGMRSADELGRPIHRWRWALTAIAASLIITAAYHLGFPEFRGAAIMAPLIGNTIITVSYLITGSPVAPLLSHVIMHAAAVLHGMEATVQLPPHY